MVTFVLLISLVNCKSLQILYKLPAIAYVHVEYFIKLMRVQ